MKSSNDHWDHAFEEMVYKWGKATTFLTKYTFEDEMKDSQCSWFDSSGQFIGNNKKQLDSSDDAATYNWGSGWRMPTNEEIENLRLNCNWTASSVNGVQGYLITSKIPGYNGSIFLPFAGYISNDEYTFRGTGITYWSSSLTSRWSYRAGTIDDDISLGQLRDLGCTIRAVLG